MQDTANTSTLAAKGAFEHMCSCQGVHTRHYHTDNGYFTKNLFTEDCRLKVHKASLCCVGAHHHNGILENTTKYLTLSTRMLLLYVHPHCQEYVTTMLWPFELLDTADQRGYPVLSELKLRT